MNRNLPKALIVSCALLLLAGCSSQPSKPVHSTMTVTGYVNATDQAIFLGKAGETCTSNIGQIAAGEQVTITDRDGKTVATADLGKGVVDQNNTSTCSFPYTVKLKAGLDAYYVQVDTLDPKRFTEAQMGNGPVVRVTQDSRD